jgi:hypothetical protein
MAPGGIVAAMRLAILALALVLAALRGSAAGAAAEPAPHVTTDTIEYCRSLAARLATMHPSAPEPAKELAADGLRLCGNGHVRTGVAKLRRAIRLARSEAD